MNRRRILPWAVAVGAVIALAAALVWRRSAPPAALPADARYDRLPESFARALHAARARTVASGQDPRDVRQLARLYQANRLYPEARSCFWLIGPAALTARDHYYLADIAQNENDLPAAQAELKAVLATEPRYVPARLALAEVLFKSGREEAAAAEYAAVIAIEAHQPQAELGLVRLALQRGDDQDAVSRLEELMAAHPESTAGAALLAQILERRGETERAAAMTQWSRQKHEPAPIDPWMDEMLGDCYDLQRLSLAFEQLLNAGQMAEALPFLARIEELDPKSWTPQLLQGWSLERSGRHPEAVQAYQAALAKGGDPEKICPLLAAALVAAGQPGEAMRLLADYHAKLPDSVPLLLAYADVAVRQGDEPRARQLLARVLQVEPYLYNPNMNLARILWAAGERAAAVECLQRVIKVFPVDVASRGLVAEYYLEQNEPLRAVPPLEQALAHAGAQTPARARLAAMLTTAYLNGGQAEAAQGRLAEAASLADKAVQLAPSELRAYSLKADASLQLKQLRPAAEALARMASLEPKNPTILLSLGDVVYQEGKVEEARHWWESARPLVAPGDHELRSALDLRLSGRITEETFK